MPGDSSRTNGKKGGRPAGRLDDTTISANEQKAIARQTIREHVMSHIPALIEAQLENALGLNYLVIRDKNGSYVEATTDAQVKAALALGGEALKVYKRQPNQPSAAMLLSYVADMPVKPIDAEITHDGELTIKVDKPW